MQHVRRTLLLLLPRRMGSAVLADLDRELALRQENRESRWTDTMWLARVGLAVALRLRFSLAMRQVPRGASILASELQLAIKGLSRNRGLTLAGVAILALGVAAPTITYSAVAAHLRPLPVRDWEQLVSVTYLTPNGPGNGRNLRPAEFAALRERSGMLGTVAGFQAVSLDLSSDGAEPVRVRAARVTHDLFDVLATGPIHGRGFVLDDADEDVAILADGLWRSHFGANQALVGTAIRLDGEPHVIIGILPDEIRFPTGAQVWTPVRSSAGASAYATVARLAMDVPLERAEDALRLSLADLSSQGGDEQGRFAVGRLAPRLGVSPKEDLPVLVGWLALATCLLLVASANVANLFVCRAISRRHAFAVRSALGAGRGRLVAMHLSEAGVISALGGVIGVGAAVWVTRSFSDVFTFDGTRTYREMRVEPAMLWFSLALIAGAGVVAGLVPAIRSAGKNVEADLRGDPRSGGVPRLGRVSQTLVVVEVALSVALVLQAFLSATPVLELPGSFETREVLAAGYALGPDEMASDEERIEFHRGLLDRLDGESRVNQVALLAPIPGRPGREASVLPAGAVSEPSNDGTAIVAATPGVFDVLGVSLLEGRDLRWSDGEGASLSVLVNEAYAQRYFRGASPVGRQVVIPSSVPQGEPSVATVVGVTPGLGILTPEGRSADAVYVPINVSLPTDVFLVASAQPGEDPVALLAVARDALDALDPDKPFHTVGTPQSLFVQQWAPVYGMAGLFGWMGMAGLMMAGTGLFAVMAFAVAGRRHELGVRRALGATRNRLVRLVLGQAGIWMAQGLLLGLPLALILRPTVPASASLGEQPQLLPLVATVLMVTGLVAAAIPALRAVHVEPTVALRAE